MDSHLQEFATRSSLIRKSVSAHQPWIEAMLGVPLSETVIIDDLPNLSEVGVPKFLGLVESWNPCNRASRRLRPLVAKADIPPHYPPLVEFTHGVSDDWTLESPADEREAVWTGLSWRECPLAFSLHVYDCTIVVLNLPHFAGPGSPTEPVISVDLSMMGQSSRAMGMAMHLLPNRENVFAVPSKDRGDHL